jgi:hypothetical protein
MLLRRNLGNGLDAEPGSMRPLLRTWTNAGFLGSLPSLDFNQFVPRRSGEYSSPRPTQRTPSIWRRSVASIRSRRSGLPARQWQDPIGDYSCLGPEC